LIAKGLIAGEKIVPSIMKGLTTFCPSNQRDHYKVKHHKKQTFRGVDLKKGLIERQPYGAQLLIATHHGLSKLKGNIEGASEQLENPMLNEFIGKLIEALESMTTGTEGAYADEYPDQDMHGHAPGDECQCDCQKYDEEASIKGFLATAQMERVELGGIGSKLKSLVASPNLTEHQRQLLTSCNNRIGRICAEARKGLIMEEPQVESTNEPQLKGQLDAFSKSFDKFFSVMDKALPHPKQ
jgi:hypothetical protein